LAGTFEPGFSRNRVVLSLLERAGFEVSVLQRSVWGSQRYGLLDAPKTRLVLRVLRAYASIVWALLRVPRPDVILVLYPGYFDMPVVSAIARLRRIPVLYDTFISLHDTVVGDRALRKPDSLAGRLTLLVDRVACRAADLILADTPQHADYFASLTGVPRSRFRVLWVGAPEDVFKPRPKTKADERLVLFYGTFIPLQGVDTIVRAAKLLESQGIQIRLIGDGQERARIERLMRDLGISNVDVMDAMPLEQLPDQIATATLCLGIFGTTAKAGRVVPNKLFQCLAVGRPVVTADTPAIRSAFAESDVMLVPPGDPDKLALAVRTLLANHQLRQSIATAGHERFVRDYSASPLSTLLSTYVTELAGRRRRRSTDGHHAG
jgi:glycosyltransferase involved in cell wall biosynthesis